MPARISRATYADMYGPTTGDKVRLADTDLAADATATLVAFGNRGLDALRRTLDEELPSATVRRAIPDVLDRIGTAEAERLLVDHLLDGDPVLRLRAVAALATVPVPPEVNTGAVSFKFVTVIATSFVADNNPLPLSVAVTVMS